ncbi:TPA: hypothetical protein N0F65_012523, partial [Lagenidium giganteum]
MHGSQRRIDRALPTSAIVTSSSMAAREPHDPLVKWEMRSDERLPAFTTREVALRKVKNANVLQFDVPVKSSVLLSLLKPKCHFYEERDFRWLHLLQAVAMVPSRKVDVIAQSVEQALVLMTSPKYRKQLDERVSALVKVLKAETEGAGFSKQCMAALRLKSEVAAFLRDWIADPVEGYTLRKTHVVNGLCLDDVVATPVGAGYLRGFRTEDQFCIVLFPWGHGFIHRRNVERKDVAILDQRKRRRVNEYIALEHQQLYEEVESLLENCPKPESSDDISVNGQDYEQLVSTLREELPNFEDGVLDRDLALARGIQSLAAKTQHAHDNRHVHADSDASMKDSLIAAVAAGANEAFKRLTDAYECLVDASAQLAYLQLHGRRHGKRKRSEPPPPPPPPPSSAEVVRRRQRTPLQVWEEFQREEERLAREEFVHKGFERVYSEGGKRRNSGSVTPPIDSDDDEARNAVLDSGLQEKACNWRSWRSKRGENVSAASDDTVVETAPTGESMPMPISVCCLLCRRKFTSATALAKHEQLSELHQSNLRAQAVQRSKQSSSLGVPDLDDIVLTGGEQPSGLQPGEAVDKPVPSLDHDKHVTLVEVNHVEQVFGAAREKITTQ